MQVIYGWFAGVLLLHCSLFMGKESLLRANWYETKPVGPRPPQFLLFVQGVCRLQFLFYFNNFENNYRVFFFFFKIPEDQHAAAFQEEEKKRNPKMFLYLLGGWVGSTPYTSYLEHDSNPNKTPPYYYYYYSHTCSSNPTAGVKIFVFFNTKNSVFFSFFGGWGSFEIHLNLVFMEFTILKFPTL